MLSDKETEDYFQRYFDLFRTPGWTQLLQTLTENLDAVENMDYLKTSEDLWKAKGAREVLKRLIGLQDNLLEQYEAAQEYDTDE